MNFDNVIIKYNFIYNRFSTNIQLEKLSFITINEQVCDFA